MCNHSKVLCAILCTLETVRAGLQVTTTSEYGLQSTRVYESSDELAAALVKCFEEAPEELRCVFREFRVGCRAEILFLTWKHWEAQQTAGVPLPFSIALLVKL